MEEVRRHEARQGFPRPLFFHQASVEAGSEFFAARHPGARAISDPDGACYEAFGMRRGGLLAVLGPSVWLRGLLALVRGHRGGKPTADVMRMPGAVLLHGRRILWQHRGRHAGDLPDLGRLPLSESPSTAGF